MNEKKNYHKNVIENFVCNTERNMKIKYEKIPQCAYANSFNNTLVV